jgi:methionyl-tRNA synthetase
VTFGQDGVISLEGFEQRYNNELANELGNLVSRVVSMIAKYRDGHLSPAAAPGADQGLAAEGEAMVATVTEHLGAVEITAALEAAWEFVRRLNRYVEEEAPWKLAKDPAQAERLDLVLHGLAAGLRLVALTLYPVIPDTAVEILRRLGQPHETADLALDQARWNGLAAADVVVAPPLFPRIDAEA